MALPGPHTGNGTLFSARFSSRILPIAGTIILLLLGALGTALKAQGDDHHRWLIALQHQQDSLRYEQGRRTPIIEAAAKTAEIVQDIRVAVAEIKQQLLYSHQVLTRLEQLQRRELRTLEGQ